MKRQSTYDNMLVCNKPNKITRCSHTVVQIVCPMVYYLMFGACGIQESDVKIKGTAANCVTLAFAIMCRLRKTNALALHYRISTIWLNPRSARSLAKVTMRSSIFPHHLHGRDFSQHWYASQEIAFNFWNFVLVMQFQMPTADSSKKIVFSPFSSKRPPQRWYSPIRTI